MAKTVMIIVLFLMSMSDLIGQVAHTLESNETVTSSNEDREKLLEKYHELSSNPVLFTHEQRVYKEDYLEGIQFPVGGIGTGCIQFNGKAQSKYWQIFNNMTHEFIPNSFFAIRETSEEKVKVRALQTESVGDFKAMEALEATTKFPFLEYHFKDDLKTDITMEVFNPFVPTDLKQSGIPAVFYRFVLKNTTKDPLELSLLASQQNAVGYSKVPIEHTENGFAFNFKNAIDKRYAVDNTSQFYGGNFNTVSVQGKAKMLYMSSSIPQEDQHYGEMALLLFDEDSYVSEATSSWGNLEQLYRSFAKDGHIKQRKKTDSSKKGATYSGALNMVFTLKPGETKVVHMALAWYFPNGKNGGFMDKWDTWGNGDWEGNGNKYAIYWDNMATLTNYLQENYGTLIQNTENFTNTLFSSNLPQWLIERLSNQLAIMKSRTLFHDKDDYVGLWEGTGGCDGSCAGNCNHVWHYAQAHARLFPELGKKIRNQAFDLIKPNGQIPYRQPAGSFAFDGQCGDILGAYREHLLSEDNTWLLQYYPAIKKAMNYVIEEHDNDMDGWLSDKAKHTTYDASMTGNPSFLSSLYLAALMASKEMALVVKDQAQADEWKLIAEKSAEKQSDSLWNGEYFYQRKGEKNATDYENGCHADQLLGQWWADQLGLGNLYPDYKVKVANEAILKYNFKSDLSVHDQGHRTFALPQEAGMVVTTWPNDDRPKYASGYSGEVWSTFEYTIGAQLFKYNKIQDALTILRTGFERYDGKYRTGYIGKWGNFGFSGNPFGDDECGQFYGRALSQWSVWLAAQGFEYNGPEQTIGFDPKWKPDDHRSFFSTAKGWGIFTQQRNKNQQINTITLKHGSLKLKQIVLDMPVVSKSSKIQVKHNGEKITFSSKRNSQTKTLLEIDEITMGKNSMMEITIDHEK
ncbi:non-lysosomal glucosylceramidase [Muricauda sp. SCSIO 64092]|uniref:GH116 family glycosyl-hydrolase n=1 Tax=Allomuricauda sp. SCSIO 64092 TaxID=2908842 RepID=UPI001FF0F5AA|nr:GH116 family glycosyl-hydrolase [Muricauda sp. SCSIO 64092]UOY04881.1 non-lysosomal glucosylceramidase [Muricauda sp. SCSIO 64092]